MFYYVQRLGHGRFSVVNQRYTITWRKRGELCKIIGMASGRGPKNKCSQWHNAVVKQFSSFQWYNVVQLKQHETPQQFATGLRSIAAAKQSRACNRNATDSDYVLSTLPTSRRFPSFASRHSQWVALLLDCRDITTLSSPDACVAMHPRWRAGYVTADGPTPRAADNCDGSAYARMHARTHALCVLHALRRRLPRMCTHRRRRRSTSRKIQTIRVGSRTMRADARSLSVDWER